MCFKLRYAVGVREWMMRPKEEKGCQSSESEAA